MSERGIQLLRTAEQQISELLGVLSAIRDEDLRSPCPGREKLGDGTVTAVASHTVETYLRIARFATGYRTAGHVPPAGHSGPEGATGVELKRLFARLSSGRIALGALAGLTDEELDRIPAAGQARFCDGKRTLEQVLAGMLKHQGHQIESLRAAIA